MMKKLLEKYSSIQLLTPAGFLIRGIEIIIALFILELLGGKEYAGVIFGTVYTGGSGSFFAYILKFLGAAYGFMYFLAIFLAPVLIIASGVFLGLNKLTSHNINK